MIVHRLDMKWYPNLIGHVQPTDQRICSLVWEALMSIPFTYLFTETEVTDLYSQTK